MVDKFMLVRLTFELSALCLLVSVLISRWVHDNFGVEASQHLIDSKACRVCGVKLDRRNKSGLCRVCNGREIGRRYNSG